MQHFKKILTSLFLLLLCQFISCSSSDDEQPEIKVGSKYKGGIVFYILQPGDPSYIEGETHGLIIRDEIEGEYSYGCNPIPSNTAPPLLSLKGKLSNQLGDGESNTKLIAGSCTTESAASIALKDGWYLPNDAEIKKLILNKIAAGITSYDYYHWTSIIDFCYNYCDIGITVVNYSTGKRTTAENRQPSPKHKIKPIKRF